MQLVEVKISHVRRHLKVASGIVTRVRRMRPEHWIQDQDEQQQPQIEPRACAGQPRHRSHFSHFYLFYLPSSHFYLPRLMSSNASPGAFPDDGSRKTAR